MTDTAISGVPEEHRHQTGFRNVPRRLCSASMPLVVLPEDPVADGNLSTVLGRSYRSVHETTLFFIEQGLDIRLPLCYSV